MRTVLVSVLLAVGACASAPPKVLPPVPGRGGPAWTEVQSEHFILWTDLPEARAKQTLRRMEHFRAVMIALVFRHEPNVPRKSLVVALRKADEWWLFHAHRRAIGFFAHDPYSGLPLLAFSAEDQRDSGYFHLRGGKELSPQAVANLRAAREADPGLEAAERLGQGVGDPDLEAVRALCAAPEAKSDRVLSRWVCAH